jgi:hypothetical protein
MFSYALWDMRDCDGGKYQEQSSSVFRCDIIQCDVTEEGKQRKKQAKCLTLLSDVYCLFSLQLDPGDGDKAFLRNVSKPFNVA